jgi:hypothetical protein
VETHLTDFVQKYGTTFSKPDLAESGFIGSCKSTPLMTE